MVAKEDVVQPASSAFPIVLRLNLTFEFAIEVGMHLTLNRPQNSRAYFTHCCLLAVLQRREEAALLSQQVETGS